MSVTPFTLVAAALLVAILLAVMVVLGLCLRGLAQQLKQQQALLEALPDGVLWVDRAGRIGMHNNAAARLLGNPDESLRGCSLEGLTAPTDPATAQPVTTELTLDGQPHSVEIRRLASTAQGDMLILPVAASPLSNLYDDAERFKRSQYFASIGTWDWSIDSDTLYWSEAIYGMFGFKPGEVTPSYGLFCSCVHPDDREQVRAGELQCIESGHNHDEEYRVVWPDGSIHWLRETGNVVKDANGQAIKMMGVVRDITEEKASVSQLQQLAHHDPLTGLPNRLQLEEHMARSLNRAYSDNTRMALVFIDLNGFKQINDEHGHAVGDQLLVGIAQRLLKTLRESDFVARLGGDEFVVIIEGLSRNNSLEKEARQISEKILQRLTQPMLLGHTQHAIGASLGVAMYPDHGPSIDSLIHIADQAMYRAKSNGNNQYYLGLPASRKDEG